MKRSWTLWLIFAGCATLVIAALAWVSMIVLRLEEAEFASRTHALLEENTRLALWRMETMLAPIVAQENARPYYSYQAFFPAERAYTRMMSRFEPNEILIPSPLLTERSSHIRLYFQLGPHGELSSPQIPTSLAHGTAMEGYSTAGQIKESSKLLKQFANSIPKQALRDAAPTEWLPMERPNSTGNEVALLQKKEDRRSDSAAQSKAIPSLKSEAMKQTDSQISKDSQQSPKPAQPAMNLAQEALRNSPNQVANQAVTVPQQLEQSSRNEIEFAARKNTNRGQGVNALIQNFNQAQAALPQQFIAEGNAASRALTNAATGKALELPQNPASSRAQEENSRADADKKASQQQELRSNRPPQRPIAGKPAEIKTSLLKAVWVHDELILVRRVRINHDEYLQGCWLDWPSLRSWLIAGIQDLLPQAALAASQEGNDQGRSLAALPIVIQPGALAAAVAPLVSPLRFSLWVAWFCVMAAILATAILLWGTYALSERRGAFVSAVTHELRTPLTTFRLYTEMLAEGMVPDPEQRRQYFNTLKQEADRQYHLIENVLAYSRIERGRYGGHKEVLSLGTWLERIQPRLRELAERSSMMLVPADEKELARLQILTDVAALERILFNLVDNACKYARTAADKRIHLEAAVEGNKVRIRIRDHGPGIASKHVPRLFKPFHKSARDAANTAPGVGLGLSLCRRLALSIGGELTLERESAEGASFSLLLPCLP
jgi:signal transduction histidine kinase